MATAIKVSKRSIGSVVDVIFWDHAQNGQVIKCRVWGKLKHVDDKQIIIRSWECSDMPDNDTNHEHFSIVKSCIIAFKILK